MFCEERGTNIRLFIQMTHVKNLPWLFHWASYSMYSFNKWTSFCPWNWFALFSDSESFFFKLNIQLVWIPRFFSGMRIRKHTKKGAWQNDGRLFVHVAFVASDKVIRCYGWKYEILSEHIDTHIVNKKGIHVSVSTTYLMCQCHKVNTYAVAVGFMSQPSFYTNLSSALRKYLIKETETKKSTECFMKNSLCSWIYRIFDDKLLNKWFHLQFKCSSRNEKYDIFSSICSPL